MEASGPSSSKRKNIPQLMIDVLGTTIAISTLILPLFLIINLSPNQLDPPLRQSKVLSMPK